jgi:hypothetical protein
MTYVKLSFRPLSQHSVHPKNILAKKTKSLLVKQKKNGLIMIVSLLDRNSAGKRGIAKNIKPSKQNMK